MNKKKVTELLIKYNKNRRFTISEEEFTDSVARYLKASKDNRIMCVINSVSKSGMSRQLRFIEQPKNHVYTFFMLFEVLGYKPVTDSDYFRIGGCGMDMVFHTNYQIIHELCSLGFITKKTQDILAQNTPTILWRHLTTTPKI